MGLRMTGCGLGAVALGLVLTGCGGSDTDGGAAGTPSPDEVMTDSMSSESPTATSAGGSAGDQVSATVTIGDETWEFAQFRCAFGHENTQSDVYSFSSDARGQHSTGAALQFQVDVRDQTGQGRLEGDGVVYEIHVTDISDFSNPAVAWESVSGMTTVTIDGDSVTAEGMFDDMLTDTMEEVPGTVEATCGAGSLR